MLRHRPPPEALAGAWPPQAPGAPPPLYHAGSLAPPG